METKNLTHGSIGGNILRFSLPYMLSYFLQILYGLADLYFIGRYCDVVATTAVSNGAQVMYMFSVIIIGLAMGTTVHAARAIGAKDNNRISRIIGNTISLFLIVSLSLMVVLLILRHDIVRIIDTPREAVDGTVAYLTVCFTGIPFIVAYNIISSIFRGLGDSKSPMYFIAVACVLNILIDYILIGILGMGPIGAAFATVLSQVTSVIVAWIAIRRHRGIFAVRKKDLALKRKVVTDILKVGVPVACQDGFIQVAFIAITVIANGRGVNDAAAVGIVEKFIGLLFIIPSAMLASVSTISAQCIGADRMRRAVSTMKYAIAVAAGFGTVAAIVLQFIPQPAVALFTEDENVISLGSEYLRGYVWDCALAGVHFCFSGFFTAFGKSIISFTHNFFSIVFFRVPLSYLASKLYPSTLLPMGFASTIGSLFSVVFCLCVFLWMRRHGKIVYD